MAIILRTVKGSELTFAEVDGNFQSLFYSSSFDGTNLVLYTTGSTSQSIDLSTLTVDTGSLMITGSILNGTLTFTKGDSSTFDLVYNTGSFSGSFEGDGSGLTGLISSSYAQTASYVENAQTASYVENAQTASYVENAQTSSLAITSSHALSGNGIFSGSFSGSFEGDGSNLTGLVSDFQSVLDNGSSATITSSFGVTLQPTTSTTTSSIEITPGNIQLKIDGGGIDSNILMDNSKIRIDALQGLKYINPVNTDSEGDRAIPDAGWIKSKFAQISGSSVTGSFTGSFIGDGSGITGVVSASYALTASYVENAQTASYVENAQTASYVENAQTASYVENAQTASYVETAQTASYVETAQTASYVENAQTASYVETAQTASYVENAQTASYIDATNIDGIVASSSYSLTSSYVENAQTSSYISGADVDGAVNLADTASFVTTAQTASYVTTAQTASYVETSQTASYVVNALTTASAEFAEITFTKGDGSTFQIETTPRQVIETVKNLESGTLVKGTPVYASGSTGNAIHIYAASASLSSRMPAAYILNEDLTSGQEGEGLLLGFINGVDTSAFASGDVVYVGANGGYTNVKPTGSNLIQNLGKVIISDAVNGSGVISGAGRSNDVPNIQEGYVWVGDSNGVATPTATSSIQNVVSSSYASTASYVENAQTASYIDATNIDGTVTSASYALTASHAQGGDGTFSGSFSGSFEGDGSGLTNVPGFFEETPNAIKLDSGSTTRDVLEINTTTANTFTGTYSLGNIVVGGGNTLGSASNVFRQNIVAGGGHNLALAGGMTSGIAVGYGHKQEGSYNASFGNGAEIDGDSNLVTGGSKAFGNNNVAMGLSTSAGTSSVTVNNNIVLGNSITSGGNNQILLGRTFTNGSTFASHEGIFIGMGTQQRSSAGFFVDPGATANGVNFVIGGIDAMRDDAGHICVSGAGNGIFYLRNNSNTRVYAPSIDPDDAVAMWAKDRAAGASGMMVMSENGGKSWIGDRIGINVAAPGGATAGGGNGAMTSTIDASLHIRGEGSTSTTTALLIEDSGSINELVKVTDDGTTTFSGTVSGSIFSGSFVGDGSGLTGGGLDINTTVNSGSTVVHTFSTASLDGGFVDYVLKESNSGSRAGNIMSVWSGASIEYNEVTTLDIGDTANVTFSMDISGGDARLIVDTIYNNWTLKAKVREI